MRGIDLRDAAPRADAGRRHVPPVGPAVAGQPHQTVVGAGPDLARVEIGRREAVDNATMLPIERIVGGEMRQRLRLAGIESREIRADATPRATAVAGREHDIESEIERPLVDPIPHQRVGAVEPIPFPIVRRRNVGRLSGALVVDADFATVDEPGMQRIRRDVPVLFDADRMEFAKADRAVVTAAGDFGAPALLLAAEDAIRKPVVGDDVIELRGRLIVPAAPGDPAVGRERRALIDAEQNDVRVGRIDPDRVVIVAAGRALDADPALPRVGRTVGRRVRAVHRIPVARIGRDAREVFGATADALFGIGLFPRCTGIIRAKDAAAVGGLLDDCVDALRVAGRDGDTDSADRRRQARLQLRPRRSAVDGFVEPALVLPFVDFHQIPGAVPRRPERRVHDIGTIGIDRHADGANVDAVTEHLVVRGPAVGRTIKPALGVRSERVAEHRDVKPVGVAWIDRDRGDLLTVSQTLVRPCPSAVGRTIHSVARREIRAAQPFAAPHIDDARI